MELNPKRIEDADFIANHSDYEQYALVYSKTLAKLSKGENDNPDSKEDKGDDYDDLGRYIKIASNNKTIYRKCQARNGIKKGEIALAGRTLKELSLNPSEGSVSVTPSSFITYK